MKVYLALFTLCIFSSNLNAQIQVQYIGNMGVLISSEESSVLIDGLHTEYNKDSYLFPPQSLVDSLTQASGDFPFISVIAATHFHGDHLDAEQVVRFLEVNQSSVFLGSRQSARLVKEVSKELDDQIVIIDTDTYQKQTVDLGDISVTGFYMNHAGPERHGTVQNVGYIVDIHGTKILHVGDSNWFEEAFNELNLNTEDIDIAIFPFWMLLDEENSTKLTGWVNPKHIIATHLPPSGYQRYQNRIQSLYPNAVSFTELRQKSEF